MEDASRNKSFRGYEEDSSVITSGHSKQRSAKTEGTREAMKAEHSGKPGSGSSGLLRDDQFLQYFSCNEVFRGGPVAVGSLHVWLRPLTVLKSLMPHYLLLACFFPAQQVSGGSAVQTLHARADFGGDPVMPDRGFGLRFGATVPQRCSIPR